MKSITLADGSQFPAFGLGTWKSGTNEVYKAVRRAIEVGYKHFDCAHVYGNEGEIGEAFRDAFKANEVAREEIWVTSKLWNSSHLKEQVRPALEKTLSHLKLDYIDLYLIHWNVASKPGAKFPPGEGDYYTPEEAPLEVTWEQLCQLKADGLIKHIGISNMAQKSVERLSKIGDMPEVIQVEAHPHLQQNELLNYCKTKKIGFTAYSPLASRELAPEQKVAHYLLDEPVVLDIAQRHEATPAQILIAWALERGTSVIPKSVNHNRIQENYDATQISLSSEDMASLAQLDLGLRYVTGAFFTGKGSPYRQETLFD